MKKCRFISINPIPNVGAWYQAEEYPTGSREKLTVIEPTSGQHFIFKYPKQRREHQLWSELLASYIAGDLLDWEVQTVSVGKLDGRLGNLLGYIYEPGSARMPQETLIEGFNFCKQLDPEFDIEKGTRHTLPLLLRVCDQVLEPQYGVERAEFLDFWARAFALDCLISNTDRHAENWALVFDTKKTRMAPLYDNGSSLGCGLDQIGLDRAFDERGQLRPDHIARQRQNGRHHVREACPAKRGALFEELCTTFLLRYPAGRRWFEMAAEIDLSSVCALMAEINGLSQVGEPYVLSQRRQRHIYAMLQIGTQRIKNILLKGKNHD